MSPSTAFRQPRPGGERGQASVELVAALPLVLLAAAVAWQLALAGHALWLCAHAARVAARADAVGRSAEAAARSALPRSLEQGLGVAASAAEVCASRFACRSLCPPGTRPSAWPPPRRSGARSDGRAPGGRPGHRGADRDAPGPPARSLSRASSCWRWATPRCSPARQRRPARWRWPPEQTRAPACARPCPGWARARARIAVDGGRVGVRMRPPAALRALADALEVEADATVAP